MKRKTLEHLCTAAGIAVVLVGAFAAIRCTDAEFHKAEVRTSTEVDGSAYESQEVLARVEALGEATHDTFTEPVETNPARGPAWNRYQPVVLRILSGRWRGRLVAASNLLHFKPSSNAHLRPGTLVHVSLAWQDDSISQVLIYKPIVRYHLVIGLIAAALCAVILFARMRGLALVASLTLSVTAASAVLFPQILNGFPALAAVAGYALLIMLVMVLLLENAGRKTLAAILGACCGLLAAVLVVLIASGPLRLSGLPTTFAIVLQQAIPKELSLNFVDLLTCGTVVCILGVVVDQSVGIASAVETVCREPGKTAWADALRAGMRMSRDVTGTMLLTLILVWAGAELHALMLPQGLGLSFRELINSEAMAVEMLRLTAAGIGLVVTGPATALISAMLFAHRRAAVRPVMRPKRMWHLWAVLGVEAALTVGLLMNVPLFIHGPSMSDYQLPRLNSAQAYYEEARRVEEQSTPAALLALWQAIELDPSLGPAHRQLARIYVTRRWFVPAFGAARRAVDLMPEDPDTHYVAGVMLLWLNQHADAEREFRAALRLDPDNANATAALKAMFGDDAP